jgi:hypothetical protein
MKMEQEHGVLSAKARGENKPQIGQLGAGRPVKRSG